MFLLWLQLIILITMYWYVLAALKFCFKTCVAMKFVYDDIDGKLIRILIQHKVIGQNCSIIKQITMLCVTL